MRSRAGAGLHLVVLLAASAAARGEVLERILVVVDERPLLLSEVQALARAKGLEGGVALERAIDERLMYAEASRAPQSAVSPEEEKAAYSSLVARLPAASLRPSDASL